MPGMARIWVVERLSRLRGSPQSNSSSASEKTVKRQPKLSGSLM
jgi:hypothetical protein